MDGEHSLACAPQAPSCPVPRLPESERHHLHCHLPPKSWTALATGFLGQFRLTGREGVQNPGNTDLRVRDQLWCRPHGLGKRSTSSEPHLLIYEVGPPYSPYRTAGRFWLTAPQHIPKGVWGEGTEALIPQFYVVHLDTNQGSWSSPVNRID